MLVNNVGINLLSEVQFKHGRLMNHQQQYLHVRNVDYQQRILQCNDTIGISIVSLLQVVDAVVIKSITSTYDYRDISLPSNKDYDITNIISLGRYYKIKHGRWIVNVTVEELDESWDILITLLENNMLDKYVVVQKTYNNKYILSITTRDYDDKENINSIKKYIRSCGIKGPMKYELYIGLIINNDNRFLDEMFF